MSILNKNNLIEMNVSIIELIKFFNIQVNSKNMFICPFHKDINPSMVINERQNNVHCFGCGVTYDCYDFVRYYNNLCPKEIYSFFETNFGLNFGNGLSLNEHIELQRKIDERKKQQEEANAQLLLKLQKAQKNYLKYMRWYIDNCHKNIHKTNYFQNRGLTNEIIERFYLGYDEKRNVVVFPYNKRFSYFQTRKIEKKEFWKPKTSKAGNEPIYNEDILKIQHDNSLVFIVESPMCAMSIAQCGGEACSICGVEGCNILFNYLINNKIMKKIVFCLDNDDIGIKKTNTMKIKFDKNNINYVIYNIADECKDPNELLMKDKERLRNNIKKAIDELKDNL